MRYFFNARLGKHLVPDDVGVELDDLHDIKRVVREATIESGLDLSQDWTFEIVDESGVIVMRLSMRNLREQH